LWILWIVVSGIATLLLAEVKAMVMLLPVPICIYYRKELFKKPIESIIVVIVALLLVVGILSAYKDIHYEASVTFKNNNQINTAYDSILSALTPKAGEDSAHVGRVTLLVNWWDSNVSRGEIHNVLFGYGIGAVHSTKFRVGKIAQRYEYRINKTSSVILLWETGVIGHLIFLVILIFGAKTSADAAKHESIPPIHRTFLRVGAISLVMLIVTLPYSNFHLLSISTQFLMMFMLGQAIYWSRFIKASSSQSILKQSQ